MQLAALVLLLAWPMGARAQPASALPPEVAEARDQAFDECRLGGGRPAARQGYVQTADFNGDGRPDYVLDDGAMECAGAAPPNCGSGGCRIEVYISTPQGHRSANLGRLGGSARVEGGARGPVLVIDGRGGTVRYRWSGNAFQPVR